MRYIHPPTILHTILPGSTSVKMIDHYFITKLHMSRSHTDRRIHMVSGTTKKVFYFDNVDLVLGNRIKIGIVIDPQP